MFIFIVSLILFVILLFPFLLILGFLAAIFFFIVLFLFFIYWLSFFEIIDIFDILFIFTTIFLVFSGLYFIGLIVSTSLGYFIVYKSEKNLLGSCNPIKSDEKNIFKKLKKYSTIFIYILKKKIFNLFNLISKFFISSLLFLVPTLIIIYLHIISNNNTYYLQEYWT